MIVYGGAHQLRHIHRVHFWWCGFAIAQQFTGIFTVLVATTKILAEAAALQLHIGTTLVTFDDWTIVTADLELAVLHLIARAIGVVSTHMQFAFFVNEIGIHGGITRGATMLVSQLNIFLRFCLFSRIGADGFIAGSQVERALAPLLDG